MARRALVPALIAALSASSCGHHIGDPCNTNADCSPLGDRFCDVSAPGGSCTVESCDVTFDVHGMQVLDKAGNPISTCPDNAVCVRFFEQIPSCPCNPATASTDCAPDQRCLCDSGDPAHPGSCLAPEGATPPMGPGACGDPTTAVAAPRLGHCAPESSERRSCQKACNGDSDCRPANPTHNLAGFQCRATGVRGAEPLTTMNVSAVDGGPVNIPAGAPAKFCGQASPSGPDGGT